MLAVAAYDPEGVEAHAYVNGAPPVAPAFNVTDVPAQTVVPGVAVALAPTGDTVTVTGEDIV